MLPVPSHMIAPLSIIGLGIFSFIIRSVAEFQLEGTGSDLALISSSLQLSLIFARVHEVDGEIVTVLQTDIFLFIILLSLWGMSIKIVQKALQSQRRIIRNFLNPYTLIAFIVGSVALSLEIYWRLQVG